MVRHNLNKVQLFFVILCLGIGWWPATTSAQEDLSLSEAIELGLQNNFGIQIADYEKNIATQNNTWGNAGLLPSVNFSGTGTFFSTGNDASFLTRNVTARANLSMSWVLFDGFRVYAEKDRLEQLEFQSAGNAAVIVENSIQAIILAYNNALLQKAQVDVLEETLVTSKERLEYEEFRRDLGASGTFELLQFKDAALVDSTNLINQILSFRNAKRNLNLVMGIPIDSEFSLTDSLTEEFEPYDFRELNEKMNSSNFVLKNQLITRELRALETKIAKAALYPQLSFNAGETFITGRSTLRNNEVRDISGALEFSSNLTLTFNLFNGGNTRRQIQNARINERISELEIKDISNSLINDLLVTYDSYEIQRNVLKLRNETVENARLNLELAQERFESGLINSLDFRTIQVQYLNSQLTKLQALAILIETETELTRLTGGLVRDTYM